MPISEKNIMNRLYLVSGGMVLFAILVVVRLVNIQMPSDEEMNKLVAQAGMEKVFTIEPNRGNLYSQDGSLLATSVPRYEIRFDAKTVSDENFETYVPALADSLGLVLEQSPSYYRKLFRKARANGNRYKLVARNLDYQTYRRIKNFPLFKLGPYKGGFIEKQRVVREYPLGRMAARSIGYEKVDEAGYYTRVGLDGAYGENYLRGREGKRLKQKIAKGQWKPVGLENIIEPQDGKDVVSTIDINIQDIAHHSLLDQLKKYKADHGCVVVMETATGEVKAISNLARAESGEYYEKRNYAIWETHEPGSTFKLMSMVAALEDKVIDTGTVVDTEKGRYKVYDRVVRDSKKGGYGKVSMAKAFAVSSNTAFAKMIHENYKDRPSDFVNRLMNMELHKDLGIPIKGEGKPLIRYPGDDGWSGISLAWMSHGYEVSLTPMQTLTFYNAIANNGEYVKPRLVKEVRNGTKVIERFDKEVLNPSICSKETIGKVKQLLKDVVEKDYGTGHDLYNPNFSMAGKTGTCQKNYVKKDPDQLAYISSFVGYFPADQPKYSCIVVIHEPDKEVGYYGADVSGPVFKTMAQKIHTTSPLIDEVEPGFMDDTELAKNYEKYFDHAQGTPVKMPNLKGMCGMDAISILENLGFQVDVQGNGKVVHQSVAKGTKMSKVKKIVLKLS